jgi:antitoxin component YwqK of YwqJK toxin-antitoxin module
MTTYYDNGKLKNQTPYEYDDREGIEKEYYENGQIKRLTTWKFGLKHGEEIWFDTTGKEIRKYFYWNNIIY